MVATINREKTGRRIRTLMRERRLSVQNVREALSLGSLQAVYHWLEGKSMPTLDNLYALSELLRVPMDDMIVGDRRYLAPEHCKARERLRQYYIVLSTL